MYIPPFFKIEDAQLMHEVISEFSFATLISQHNGMPFATHLPLFLDDTNSLLYGHFARANSQWKDIVGQPVLAIFHGPHSYISSSWYETKDAVPTWNYVTVHAYGEIKLMEDADEIKASLHTLIDKYELPTTSYSIEDVDDKYLAGLNKCIIPFKLQITKLEGKAKLSQNHPKERQQLVIDSLRVRGDDLDTRIAHYMENDTFTKK